LPRRGTSSGPRINSVLGQFSIFTRGFFAGTRNPNQTESAHPTQATQLIETRQAQPNSDTKWQNPRLIHPLPRRPPTTDPRRLAARTDALDSRHSARPSPSPTHVHCAAARGSSSTLQSDHPPVHHPPRTAARATGAGGRAGATGVSVWDRIRPGAGHHRRRPGDRTSRHPWLCLGHRRPDVRAPKRSSATRYYSLSPSASLLLYCL
jgi:hypothetical protein